MLCLLLVRAAAAAPSITLEGRDALAFTLVDNRIFVAVTVNGRGPYQFIFDSGGSNILDLATARELGLTLEGDNPAEGAGAATQQAWRTRVDDAALGPVRMRSQEFMVLSLDTIRRAIGFRRLDGVVGRELFQRFLIDIDYRASKLGFIDRSLWTPSPSWKNAVPLTFVGSIPAMQGAVDGVAGTFVIDTGDRSSLTLFGPFVERHGLRARHSRKVRAVTGWAWAVRFRRT